MKEDLKKNPWNKKSGNFTLISRRNRRLNKAVFFENVNSKITEIKLNYNSKTKFNAKKR